MGVTHTRRTQVSKQPGTQHRAAPGSHMCAVSPGVRRRRRRTWVGSGLVGELLSLAGASPLPTGARLSFSFNAACGWNDCSCRVRGRGAGQGSVVGALELALVLRRAVSIPRAQPARRAPAQVLGTVTAGDAARRGGRVRRWVLACCARQASSGHAWSAGVPVPRAHLGWQPLRRTAGVQVQHSMQNVMQVVCAVAARADHGPRTRTLVVHAPT